MNTALTLALEMRPKCLWGFYLYPDGDNYDYRINLHTYTGNCPNDEIFHNDQLQWQWEKKRTLYFNIFGKNIEVKFEYFEICSLLS